MEATSLLLGFLAGVIVIGFVFYWLNNSEKTRFKQLKQEFDNLTAKHNETVVEKTVLETQLVNSMSNASELLLQIAKEQENCANQQNEINLFQQKIVELTTNNNHLTENISKQNELKREFDNLTAKYNENIVETTKLETQLTANNNHLSESILKQSELKLEFDNLTAKYNENVVDTTKLEEQLNNSENNASELLRQMSKEQEISANQQNEINIYKQKIAEFTANNKSISENLSKQNENNSKQTAQIEELNSKNSELTAQISKLTANNDYLSEKLANQKTEIEELQRTAHLQFEKIANRLFEEKSSKFAETNKLNIETLLNPLKEDINKFKTRVEDTYDKESKQRFSLEERVKELIEQTNKVSAEANNLATALKGKPQKRGQWGEMILERILESSGLTKDKEYLIQKSIKNEDDKTLRPDVLIRLPDERQIIIDSKVSLIDYDKFIESENPEEQKIFLDSHVRATKVHIDQLSEKKYDDLDLSLDFTMMFVPIESAYIAALQNDEDLWSYAYEKRILLVNPTNLIACLKLISDLWKREWQNKNAMEIVKRGEKLYEKFVNFSVSFLEIGKNIEKSQDSYDKALKQMRDGKGNLVQNAWQLKNLGLKSSKEISPNLLTSSEIDYIEIDTEEDI